jgi:DNA (cytosine-5)-methyltransferase 1
MTKLRVAGLFAGIGGIEHGFRRALGDEALETALLCDWWQPAQEVLASRFPSIPIHGDVTTLATLPRHLDLLAAGFPCTDLSQAGRTAGIHGGESGLAAQIFRLLDRCRSSKQRLPRRVLIENVPNMLVLGQGTAMRYLTHELERLGYRWAYRVVDSRFAGVPQRRRRVLLLASRCDDPRQVLFADDAGERPDDAYHNDAFGFYWTEGRGGLGWARDAVPTLKGGSTIGIPSPPAIWIAGNELGRKIVIPTVEDAEEMQGFPRGWTAPGHDGPKKNGPRWKLVGNAVTVGVAEWLAGRLVSPGQVVCEASVWDRCGAWPSAAWGAPGAQAMRVVASEFPVQMEYRHLTEMVDINTAEPLTLRGARGFWARLSAGNLGRQPGFRKDVAEHVEAMDPVAGLVAVS